MKDLKNEGLEALSEFVTDDEELNKLSNTAIYHPEEEEALFIAITEREDIDYTQEQLDYVFEEIEEMRGCLE
jgi:F0F1-type ATP synthase delta subunit